MTVPVWDHIQLDRDRYALRRDGDEVVVVSLYALDRPSSFVRALVEAAAKFYGHGHYDVASPADEPARLDMDEAAEEIADLISAVTGNEVDGDGDPWSIVLDHLAGVVGVIAEARRRFLLLDAWLVDEYAYTPIAEIDARLESIRAAVSGALSEIALGVRPCEVGE